MEPFKLIPAYKDYLWGGSRLSDEYHKETGLFPLAESWELSCHPDGPSVVGSGPCAGTSFPELLSRQGEALCGARCARLPFFPVLIKLIDAKAPLSIQVHPSDGYALEHEHSYGKTEMWLILDAEPGSYIYYGTARELQKDEVRAAVAVGTMERLLQKRAVRPGDVVFIPAGTLHALGEGVVLCEIQQNSNLTYRVYDYNRRGKDGKLRELHLEKALEVADLHPAAGSFAPKGEAQDLGGGAIVTGLAACEYFRVRRLALSHGRYEAAADGQTFCCVVCIGGEMELVCGGETLTLRKGESAFIPADAGAYALCGSGECVLTEMPEQ